jgi:C1A family cysteine protease
MSHPQYGWRPDRPDQRDHLYAVPVHVAIALPPSVSLRALCPPVFDQGQLGSCTANAIGNAHRFDQMKQQLAVQIVPARLFIYYNERASEGTINSDAGAAIRDGIKSVGLLGVCDEAVCPYLIARFTRKPSARAYHEAIRHKAVIYQSVAQSLDQMKGCLAAGYPFVFGFTVYDSFESQAVAQSGVVPMPGLHEKSLGGHAVLCVGYDDATGCFLVMNSWGEGWGQGGYFTIPYAYLTNPRLAADFWTLRVLAA